MKQDLRARSRLLRTLVDIVVAALMLVLVVETFAMLRGREVAPELLVRRLPMLFYLWAIWNARQAIAAIGRGELFGQIVPRLLSRVGLALFVGALTNVFFGQWLLGWMGRGWGLAYLDVSAITVGVIGATLAILAQLLRQASRMRQELDEFL
jgi:hypothetical protein